MRGPVVSGDWRDRGVCGGKAALFFGPDGEAPEARDVREARAIAVCRPCPVRQPCLDDALSRQSQIGVAGGVGVVRRKALRRAMLKRQKRRQERRAA